MKGCCGYGCVLLLMTELRYSCCVNLGGTCEKDILHTSSRYTPMLPQQACQYESCTLKNFQQVPDEFVELMSAPLLSNMVMTSSWSNKAASVKGVLPEWSLACKFASASSNADKLSLSLSQMNENIDMSLLDRLCKVIALLSVGL